MKEPKVQQELPCAAAVEAKAKAMASTMTSTPSKKPYIGIPIARASLLVGVIKRKGLGINLKKKKAGVKEKKR